MYSSTIRGTSNETRMAASRQSAALKINPGDGDHSRFARLVLPHLGDAYSLARWITGNPPTPKM
jgi:hypothetical protein